MQLNELIDVLIAEGQAHADELQTWAQLLGSLDDTDAPEGLLRDAAHDYADFCLRAGSACATLGLEGLAQTATALAEGVGQMGELPLALRTSATALLRDWPGFFVGYLQGWAQGEVHERAVSDLLVAMAEAEYVTPLGEVPLLALGGLLMAPPTLEAQATALRPDYQPLDDAALALAIPADAERELVDGFLAEAPKHLAAIEAVVAVLGQGRPGAAVLDLAHRSAHTLKGTAAIVGVSGVVTLAHALEDVLEAWRRPDFAAPQGLLPVLQAGCEQLEQAFEHLAGAASRDPDFDPVSRALHAWAARLDGLHVPDAALALAWPEVPAAPELAEPATVPVAPSLAPSTPDDEPQVRMAARTLDAVFRALNELSVGLLRLRTDCEAAYERCNAAASLDHLAVQRVQALEQAVALQGWARRQQGGLPAASAPAPGGAAAAPGFDTLELEQYTELTGLTQALHESLSDQRLARGELLPTLRELATQAQHQLQLAREAQYQIARARLYPLSDLRARLRRTVRQTCAAVGREVALEITGDDLRVDAAVLGPLSDALLHLLRNSVDHGIESPEEREALGKPRQGVIRVRFASLNGGVQVRVMDDGRGLDLAAIQAKAVRHGLVPADLALSPEQIARLIFLPGFSTRSQVTETSGRGVGLDVVAQTVAALQGQVSVQATPGAGTEFRLFVLASIGTIHALHVQSGDGHFLIPSVQLLRVEPAPILAEDVLPGIPTLAEVLHGRDPRDASPPQPRPLLVLEVDGAVRRIAVDKVVQAREFLITPPPSLLGRLGGVSGVAALQEGTLGLVLDLIELARHPLPVLTQNLRRLQALRPPQRPVLVVDDSASVRQTLGTLLRDADLPVVLARDGLEAIQLLQTQAFSLVFTDLEMPRVNGLELTEHIRQRSDQPGLPVVMITSRGQDKHRQQAQRAGVDGFIVKPYTDHQVLMWARQFTSG